MSSGKTHQHPLGYSGTGAITVATTSSSISTSSNLYSTQESHVPDRTGTGTISLFAPPSLRFSLADSTLPLITTKKTFLRGIIEELLWFVKGKTDSTLLSQKGVKIWDGNGSKEFLEKRGLGHRRAGDLGPVYGFQWRHFGAEYGVDQLREVIRKIIEDPADRRIILSAWNPAGSVNIPLMALPPCHMMCQFYPHELIIQLGDAHVYRDHVDALNIQLTRQPRPFPTLRWTREITDIEDFTYEDFVIEGYDAHPAIPMKMSV
ncbi:thymidylate synthase [Lactarius indigo]|nr:thymidylate synthase [Lactarius indigo]